ncbi:MAG: aminotransferase class I/II-fold pyridoxal phosphate-dependent enzyme [Synergistaceae bacterium]|jgi:threonine-phosphate decarboxylase|nr:aminotransferase class I/II-fold pyridoxal phosphate-dependent enzyme [Synergistaceae bacterium]
MRLHGGNIYDLADHASVIDFSSNINPFGPPDYALRAAGDSLALIKKYPDTDETEIRRAFAEWLGKIPDAFVFGNGASEMIRAVMESVRPGRVLIPAPTFSEYAESARLLGIEVVEIPSDAEKQFAFDVERIVKIFARHDLLIICQPNNPTGISWTEGELDVLLDLCRERGGYMMADECFLNLTYPQAPSCLRAVGDKNIIVLRAITKDFAAPGLRVGFTVSHPDMARVIRSHIQPWPLNCVGEAYAIACARRPEPFLSESARHISFLREDMLRKLRGMGYWVCPSDVNFILARSGAESSDEIYSRLLKSSILIRRCSNFSNMDGRFFRLAVRPEDEQEKLFSELAMIGDR